MEDDTIEISDEESSLTELREQLEIASQSDAEQTSPPPEEEQVAYQAQVAEPRHKESQSVIRFETPKPNPKQAIMTDPVSYTLNGITIAVNPKAVPRKEGAIYTKAKRKSLEESERMKLLESVQAKQQTLFHAINVSVNDPEKMTNTYSLANLLAENKRNLAKYDLLDVYTIVDPMPGAFDPDSNDYGKLRIDEHGNPASIKLFADYLRLTPSRVAASSEWYSQFVPIEQQFQEDLNWSLSYYEKNVKDDLYQKVYNKLLKFPPDSYGGPLFLKLLLDQVTTTSEANLKSLLHIIETYQIKVSCPGEDVEKVVSMFDAIFDNVESLRNGVLPPDSTENLLKLLQTTSVPKFNAYFAMMTQELASAEIETAVDPNFRYKATGTSDLANNMRSIKWILGYAERAYRNLVKKGDWDACLQKAPGKSAFLTENTTHEQPTKFDSQTAATAASSSSGFRSTCFNCGGDHRLKDCPHPRDRDRIAKARSKHPSWIKINEQRHKWRSPEKGETNKRVIDGAPHTWDPSGGRNGYGRWIKDETPPDGQPNEGAPPKILLSDVQSFLSGLSGNGGANAGETPDTSADTSSNDKRERQLAIHLQMEKLKNELNSL
jgi:hypothetical protein